MDGIQPYGAGARPLVAHVHSPTTPHSAVKSPSDYIRAIRRRIWLALAVAIPVATGGTLMVLRMAPVYLVKASIEIKPPKVDPAVASLVSHGEVGRNDPVADEKYVPDALNQLNSKALLVQVFRDPSLALSDAELEGDPAAELVGKIKTREYPRSHQVDVSLEGRDPARITEILKILLRRFVRETESVSQDGSQNAIADATSTRDLYISQLKEIESKLAAHVRGSTMLGPGGKNLKEAQYEAARAHLGFVRQQAGHLRNELTAAALSPTLAPAMEPGRAQSLTELQKEHKRLNKRLDQAKRIARDPYDPAVMRAKTELLEVSEDLARIQGGSTPGPAGMSRAEISEKIFNDNMGDIRVAEAEVAQILGEMKDALPEHQKLITLEKEHELKSKQLADLSQKLSEFQMLFKTQKPPVRIIDAPEEPTVPIKPNKPLYIAACIVMALGLGIALVCFLEHIDHSVKVPEHLTAGLGLPLFGVVPRMRRLAKNHRGGHLWTPGIPESIEADAYRNLRASLLGATRESKPIVTLLITSAKAGEGKSTTALNLAATCARAGERTLLMDVDLRRPSLVDVFTGHGDGTGLVDVLRGDLPWQRTVVQTDLPNLDFLPTGDTRDVPIEVLGSLELRQLLISLSQHHYDRVILDGPAILGLADCRMLGRIVDAALLVVRSGSQELRPLQRAKAMLEQSMVTIAGVVFNGLNEDLENWSSYGPSPMIESWSDPTTSRSGGASRGLDDRRRNAGSLMASASADA
ncbi:GumC family protein [Tundrisphaera lichenicola]|uniref:GumC family protein n=1 Tax=Tundrisphaera lichenicola TaxID=2029860 RepID=UPI003EB77C9E